MSDISRRGLLRGAAGLSVAGGAIAASGVSVAEAAPTSVRARTVDVVVVGAGLAGHGIRPARRDADRADPLVRHRDGDLLARLHGRRCAFGATRRG